MPTSGTDQNISFYIRSGVAVYGGFAGLEGSRDARDPVNNVSVLSGDIDNNDVNSEGNQIDETSADIIGNNSFHVVYLDGTTGTPITAATVLDGFTITGGNGDAEFGYGKNGAGLFCDGTGEGNECSPRVENLRFTGNKADAGGAMIIQAGNNGSGNAILSSILFSGNSAVRGGALYITGSGDSLLHDTGISSPTLSDIVFIGNVASLAGGAMYIGTGGGVSSPTLTNVAFNNNTAGYGGALHIESGNHGTSSPVLTNVTFEGNNANAHGGALYNDSGDGGTSNPTLSNVTFHGNSADYGGALFNYVSYKGGSSSPVLSNVILWGDVATNGSEIFNFNDAYAGYVSRVIPTIDHSVVQGSGGSDAWNATLGIDGGGNLDADPNLGSLGSHGGFTATLLLGAGSAAIDTGSDVVCDGVLVNGEDQRGVSRPQGLHCDIGSVEMETPSDLIFANGFEL